MSMAVFSLLHSPGITMGIWGMTMGGLVYAQWSRWIEKFDLLIIAGVTGRECNLFAVFA